MGAPVEPEEKTLTLEEYYAQRKKSNRNPNARQAEEKEAATNVQVERTKKGRAARVKEVYFKPAPIASRRGDNRGGRGREVVAVVTVVQVTDHETTNPRKPLLISTWNQISQLLAKKSSYHLKYFLGLI